MPYSDIETKPWGMWKIFSVAPKRILDVGAGAGVWVDWLRFNEFKGTVDAVEVWEPYIVDFGLVDKYDHVFKVDVREHDYFDYDVVILGDIVEHMSKEDALELVERIGKQARYILIAIPIVHYHQGAEFGNPYEVHVKEDWSHEEMLESFPNIIDSAPFVTTGAYWLCYRP